MSEVPDEPEDKVPDEPEDGDGVSEAKCESKGGVEMLKALWLLGIWMCILTFPIGEL